jgi:phosphate:Na+ symporter
MIADLLRLAGWLGLFLLGMVVLTDGLRAIAGNAASRILYRFTSSPLSGAATGAIATAIIQSSTVVTVATVGFVGAGMLSFPQALGIVWGANLGTTLRGWLVALIGFKTSLTPGMLLLLLTGTLLRIFGNRRWRDAGWALAGFALIFVAIDQMRMAMEPFREIVTPQSFPADSAGGRLLLVFLGIGITLVTQSSSAGVALALTAVNAGAISFPQAAAMVIGMDIGTTSTSALATLGGSPQVRRTGFSHVVFNLFTGTGAFLLLPLYVGITDRWFADVTDTHPELALVGFHTTFNMLGVLCVLPITARFAAMMCRIIPDAEPSLTERLDPILARDPPAGILAVWLTVHDLSAAVVRSLGDSLASPPAKPPSSERWEQLAQAIVATRRYADGAWPRVSNPATERYRKPILHCLDHLERIVKRGRQTERIEATHTDPQLDEQAERLRRVLAPIAETLMTGDSPPEPDGIRQVRDSLVDLEPEYRQRTLDAVGPDLHFDDAVARLDAARWLRRSAYHAWRITHHLSTAGRVDVPSDDS